MEDGSGMESWKMEDGRWKIEVVTWKWYGELELEMEEGGREGGSRREVLEGREEERAEGLIMKAE